jgi:diguanylate cyclase (GGDEF)-like protein
MSAARIQDWLRRLRASLDALIYRGSIFGVPVVIGVVTLVALSAWNEMYPEGNAVPLKVSVLEDAGDALSPAQAMARLGDRPVLPHHDTRLSESPFWFSFVAQPAERDAAVEVELPSRHASEVACWEGRGLHSLGQADRTGAAGRIKHVKAGFAIDLGRVESATTVVCRGRFAGPARISVLQWPASQLRASAEEFHRNTGLLEGGVLVLAAFVLVTAIINREWLYVLFAAWLLASLRMGAISAGWDIQWFERAIPPEWILPVRKLTIAAYYLLTYALFSRLFREEIERVGHASLLAVAQGLCLVLLGAAVALPFSSFLPVLWVVAAVGIAVIVFFLVRILLVTRSAVAVWYSGSLAIVLLAGLTEVVAAALGLKALVGAVNSVTAALSSALLAALAIAAQMQQERRKRLKARAALRVTYDVVPIGLFTLDRTGAFERVNPTLVQMLGTDPAREPARYWADLFDGAAWAKLQEGVRSGEPYEMDMPGRVRGGDDDRWFHVKAVLTRGRIEGSLQDVTEQHDATDKLRFLAANDPLTGVLNRRGIEKALGAAGSQLSPAAPLALAYLDLDRFKLINDLFGHKAGDEVLRQVCRRIEGLLAGGHSLGRVGGDEFVIVFAGTPIRAASAICRGIVEAIGGAPYAIGDTAFQVKASIGLVDVAGEAVLKDAISIADGACRAAKREQHDGLVVYERGARALKDRERELRLIARLGSGNAPEGLFLEMQPILSLRSPLESLNFEVLVRMRDRDGSVVPAGVIVPAAEYHGRAAVIDRWVLETALAWLERNHDRLGATRFMAMNLSGASLNDEKFVADAFAIIAAHRRAAKRLCIEITESVALHDLDNTTRLIDRLRGYGAKIALDDFGAGYTSFSYLKDLPADAVKIDGSLVRGVNAHPANLAIVEAIVDLGRNLGMNTVAEWVEDRATVEALAQVGVDHAQGYAIARPQDPERILRADSAASFVQDPQLARFLRELAMPPQVADLLVRIGDRPQPGLH